MPYVLIEYVVGSTLVCDFKQLQWAEVLNLEAQQNGI